MKNPKKNDSIEFREQKQKQKQNKTKKQQQPTNTRWNGNQVLNQQIAKM